MVSSIDPVGKSLWRAASERAWDVITIGGRAPLGIIEGCKDATNLYSGTALPEIALSLEKNDKSIGKVSYSFFRWLFGDVIGKGAVALRDTGFKAKLGEALGPNLNFKPFADILGPITKGGIGFRGSLLTAGVVGIGVLATVMGIQGFFGSWKRLDNLQKGYHDLVPYKGAHIAQGLSFLTTGIGGVAMFCNPVVGLATIGAGLAGSIAMGITNHFIGGVTMFRYPEKARWPFNLLFGLHRNPSLFEVK